MLELALMGALGFLGSFGHCAGMCGPLVVALSISGEVAGEASGATLVGGPGGRQQWLFHCLLNVGRLLSYGLGGAVLGGLGSMLAAGGQLAGIDSGLRQGLSAVAALLLIWLGLAQVRPAWLPRLPLWHPLAAGAGRSSLERLMGALGGRASWWMPLAMGSLWGLIPCGFLYAAQLKAVEAGSAIAGGLTMLAFGLGTVPTMLAAGLVAGRLSRDRRGQLFRLGGWITLAIGGLTLLRSSAMQDWTGHGALVALGLALVAGPLQGRWPALLRYRRAIGVGAYILALVHTGHMMDHSFQWQVSTWEFLLPWQRWGLWAGVAALGLLTPLALTSCDRAVRWLGPRWRSLHLLAVPALGLAGAHTLLLGSSYGGSGWGLGRSALVVGAISLVGGLRLWVGLSKIRRSA